MVVVKATTLFVASTALPLRHARRPLGAKSVAMAMKPSTPPAKRSFYKNPSKAIEKGGGFFIPGLRGPRLRFFVSLLSISLLSLNHLASPAVRSPTLTNSEVLAALAALSVFTTAVLDSVDSPTEATEATEAPRSDPISSAQSPESAGKTTLTTPTALNETVTWAIAVCSDLTPVSHIAVVRSDGFITATPNVNTSVDQGPVVRRVRDERRSLYIADSTQLPEGINFPFLPDSSFSAFLVPLADTVVTFACPSNNGNGGVATPEAQAQGLSADDRKWLLAFANKIIVS